MLPLILFIVLSVHGASLGLSDDEAYYWVLAQKLSFAYAYHPPAVAGFIAFFQVLLGGIFGTHSAGLVRLPAALSSAAIFGMSLAWLKELGLKSQDEFKAAAVLLSFFGFFALSWMMVPDIPLFVGWMIMFTQCWRLCFGIPSKLTQWGFCLGVCLTLLSKYSGILSVFSAFLALSIWAPREKLKDYLMLLFLGSFIGILPSVVWNYSHQWVSLLYQVRDRHEGSSVSLVRYLRFWGVECILVGPLVVGYFFKLMFTTFLSVLRSYSKAHGFQKSLKNYIFIWVLPAATVFCIQPLFSDFKPHWAFIVWWPVVLLLAFKVDTSRWKWIRFQSYYGLLLGSFILISCHFPIASWIINSSTSGKLADARLDVTNDFYGWNELEGFIKNRWGSTYASIPVIGSRYQTASQAKFNLSGMNATLLPRDMKDRDEWPALGVSDTEGPDWPKLTSEIFFVADNRFDAGPQFVGAHCDKIGRFEKSRFHLLAKWIDVWHCIPQKG